MKSVSKLSKRKSIVLVGNRIDTAYERQKNMVLTAKEVAERTSEEIKNKNIRYDIKRKV